MRARYNQQFKDEAVALALVLESDCPYSQIARDLDINYQTFGNWIRAAVSKSSKPNDKKKTIKKDYQALERENRSMRKELDPRKKEITVLKKATAYFAKEHL